MNILVSNGTNRFHLAPLAASLSERSILCGFLTAGWPKGWQRVLASRFANIRAVRRFLDRHENIKPQLIHSFTLVELISQIALRLSSYGIWLDSTAQHLFAFKAKAQVSRLRPTIYHYRCCFGLSSVPVAKTIGAIALCDHSIAHPDVISFLVESKGVLPCQEQLGPKTALERRMKRDLNDADYVVVNSEFVKQTCIHAGMPSEKIFVIYWGVDDKFLNTVPSFDQAQVNSRDTASVLFAGSWQKRKGISALQAVFNDKNLPKLEIAGPIERGEQEDTDMQGFLSSPRVRLLGNISREALARKMTEHRIFIFPSLCEGSARVIFEAMACGCFIITTPNSGSIVEDNVHGKIVPPSDPQALRQAVEWALANTSQVASIGWKNAQVIRSNYRQQHYANKVVDLYGQLSAQSRTC